MTLATIGLIVGIGAGLSAILIFLGKAFKSAVRPIEDKIDNITQNQSEIKQDIKMIKENHLTHIQASLVGLETWKEEQKKLCDLRHKRDE